MKIDVHDIEGYKKKLFKICNKQQLRVFNLSYNTKRDTEEPLYLVANKIKADKPSILIAGGFHGNEPAGPWGILYFIHQYYEHFKDKINISFFPLVNLTGFKYNQRKNIRGDDPNRNFKEIEQNELSIEGKILLNNIKIILKLCKDGFLSLHEDLDVHDAYMFSHDKTEIVLAIKDVLSKHFKLAEKDLLLKYKSYRSGKYDGAIILDEKDGSFEDYLHTIHGIPNCIVTETPGLEPLIKRIQCDKDVIKEMVEYIIKGK